MTKPTSKVDICNLALDLLAEEPIASVELPATNVGKTCARWYDETRRALLRQHTWNFAKKRGVLSRGGTPEFGYADYYNLPNDYIRLIGIMSEYEELRRTNYELEGRTLLINNDGGDSLNIRYIRDEEVVTLFDPLFVNLFAHQLAVNIAFKITTKNAVVARVKQLEADLKIMATAIDSQDRPPIRVENSRFNNARRRIGTVGGVVASPYLDI